MSGMMILRCHDTQHNDIQHNTTHNFECRNVNHQTFYAMLTVALPSAIMLSALIFNVIVLSAITPSVILLNAAIPIVVVLILCFLGAKSYNAMTVPQLGTNVSTE
jgi:hypothetical protein